MSRFNTGNPLGSNDPRDLDDNAKNMDLAVNSEDSQWIDRFGRPRLPLMEQERQFVAAQERHEDEFQSEQEDRSDRFNDFIAASGYQFVGDYGPGIEITEYNQLIRDSNGEFWRVSGQVDLPYVTTGAGIPEDDALVPAGDAVLRQDLANPAKGAAMVARGVVAVDSIADLLALPSGQRKEGLRYLVKGYHAGSDVGGGEFYFDSSSEHIIDDAVVFGVEGSSGRFFRLHRGALSPADAGCVLGESDSSSKLLRLFTSAITHGLCVEPETENEEYKYVGDLNFEYPGKTFRVNGKGLKITSSDGYLGLRGSITDLGGILAADLVKGDDKISVLDVAGIHPGDTLAIHNSEDYSFSSHRPQYRSGEFVKVLDVVGDEVLLERVLLDSYPASTTNIYKLDTARVHAKDFHVVGGNRHSSLRLSFIADFELTNCSARGGYQRGLMVDRCSVGLIDGGSYVCDAPAGTGGNLQYGINYHCSEDIEARGVYAFGTRHPIASGGDGPANIVTRRCNTLNSILQSSSPGVHGPDFHGNTEDCHFYDCVSNQAVGLAGKDCSWFGGTIGALPGSTVRPMSWHEVVGGEITFKGVRKAVAPAGQFAFGQINTDISVNIDYPHHIIIDDIAVSWDGVTGGVLGVVTCNSNKPTMTDWRFTVTNIRSEGRSGPFSAILSIGKGATTPPIGALTLLDIDGWDDAGRISFSDQTGVIGPNTKITATPYHRRASVTLAGGNWLVIHTFALPIQLRAPAISALALNGASPYPTTGGGSVWLSAHVIGSSSLTNFTVRVATPDSSHTLTTDVTIPITLSVTPI